MAPPPSAPGENGPERVAALKLVEQLQPALRKDERAAIVEILQQLVVLRSPMAAQWLPLALIAADNGELRIAREAIALYVDSHSADRTAPYKKVALLGHIGAWQEAHALLGTLSPELPDPATYAYSRGTAALYVGQADEARRYLEQATRLQPRLGQAWLSLATVLDLGSEPDLAERIVAGEREMERASASERGLYYYALGKARADRGEHSGAFAAFAQGARLMKHQLAYSRDRDRLTATEAVAGYEAERIAAIARQQSESTARTIFVLGQPRSGTTLVEQILTSHSAVIDGGEINRLPLLVKDIGGVSHAALGKYVEEVGAPVAARLWSHWIEERFPAPGRVVDKTFNTSRMLGLAAALLPEAPLIWLTRDPLDCAWSCFRNRFTGGAPWSYDLEDIAFHFRLEDELLSRWQQILGDRLLVVPFEALVTEPDQWIQRILRHCGLADEPGAFAPHENRRVVTTSSVMQVRRPINRQGIGAAEPYRRFLEPFLKAYHG